MCWLCLHRNLIFQCAGYVIVRGNQKLNPHGYKAPVVKASQCGNERQERSYRRKAGRKGRGKNVIKTQSILFNNKSVLAQNNEEQKNLMNNNRQHQESNLCYLSLRGIFLTRRIWALAIHHFLSLMWLFLYHCRIAKINYFFHPAKIKDTRSRPNKKEWSCFLLIWQICFESPAWQSFYQMFFNPQARQRHRVL